MGGSSGASDGVAGADGTVCGDGIGGGDNAGDGDDVSIDGGGGSGVQ